jgi:hypothetical protein
MPSNGERPAMVSPHPATRSSSGCSGSVGSEHTCTGLLGVLRPQDDEIVGAHDPLRVDARGVVWDRSEKSIREYLGQAARGDLGI